MVGLAVRILQTLRDGASMIGHVGYALITLIIRRLWEE